MPLHLALFFILISGGGATAQTPALSTVTSGMGSLVPRQNQITYQAEVLALAPTWYSPHNDTTTTGIDLGSAAHNGTYVGTYAQSQASLIVGAGRAAVKYGNNGNTGSLFVGPDATHWAGLQSIMSMAAWVKIPCNPTSGQHWPVVSLYNPGNTIYWWFDINGTTSKVRFGCASNSPSFDRSLNSTTSVTNGNTYFLVQTYYSDGAGWRFKAYVNATVESNGSGSQVNQTINVASSGIMVSAYYGQSQNAWNTAGCNGATFQELALWVGRELVQSEITRLYNVGVTGAP